MWRAVGREMVKWEGSRLPGQFDFYLVFPTERMETSVWVYISFCSFHSVEFGWNKLSYRQCNSTTFSHLNYETHFSLPAPLNRFGRKLAFLLNAMALLLGGIGIAFAKSLVAINVCRFFLGMAKVGIFVNGFVLGKHQIFECWPPR